MQYWSLVKFLQLPFCELQEDVFGYLQPDLPAHLELTILHVYKTNPM